MATLFGVLCLKTNLKNFIRALGRMVSIHPRVSQFVIPRVVGCSTTSERHNVGMVVRRCQGLGKITGITLVSDDVHSLGAAAL